MAALKVEKAELNDAISNDDSILSNDDTEEEEIEGEDAKMIECPVCNLSVISFMMKEHKETCGGAEDISRDVYVDEDTNDTNGEDSDGYQGNGKLATCQCCDETIDKAHTTGKFKCPDCNFLFTKKKNLNKHIDVIHSITNDDIVSDQENTSSSKENKSEGAKAFACPRCNRVYTRKFHLDRHVQQTGCDGKQKPSFPCRVCGKVFHRKDNLRDHLRLHTGEQKPKKIFPCSVCKREFNGPAVLYVHMRTHTGEKPFKCDLCPKAFPSSGAKMKHRRVHTGERPYKCKECDKTFAAKETLNRHSRTHTNDKPHVCSFCGQRFIQASQLRAHIFHHTGEYGHKCEECGKTFNRRIRLTMHMKFVHEGAEPIPCDQCDKTFIRKEDLQRHLILHSGIKEHECEVCKKRFAIKSSLKIHALTHRKEQPRSCHDCGRAFIRQDCLIRHMRAKHRDDLQNIMMNVEKKRLIAAVSTTDVEEIKESPIWTEVTLTNSIKELLMLLVDEESLESFGWPETPVDKLLDLLIIRCGHTPAKREDYSYVDRLRENTKLLFTAVIDDQSVKTLLNNKTVDEVIQHVLKLAKS